MKLRIVRKKGDNGTVFLTMIGELTVYTVTGIKDILLRELDAFSGIVMNLAGINDADTAGFQLLLFLRREAGAAGKSFAIDGASERVKSIFNLYKENII